MIPLTLVFVTEAHQPRRMRCCGRTRRKGHKAAGRPGHRWPELGRPRLDHVIEKQVLPQNVLGEIVFHVPPDGVDVVGAVLPVVKLH